MDSMVEINAFTGDNNTGSTRSGQNYQEVKMRYGTPLLLSPALSFWGHRYPPSPLQHLPQIQHLPVIFHHIQDSFMVP